MIERPILFSAPMVRALLAGRKTQTRRIVKLDVPADAHEVLFWSGEALKRKGWTNVADPGLWARRNGRDGYINFIGRCPYGVPGDALWVKETWSDVNLEGGPGIAYRANGDVRDLMADDSFLDKRGAFDYDDARLKFGKGELQFCMWSGDLISGVEGHSWRSPLHMPRWASRITLDVVDVRVERLQDISAADAAAEGCDPIHMQPGGPTGDPSEGWLCYREGYRSLWDQINGAGSWDANPWVWAVTFRKREADA